MNTEAINVRYTKLAESDCCLSCGGAINYSNPAEGEKCVDLGSGKGTDVIRLAELVGENGFVYGIDISEGMLQTARNNAQKFNVTNAEFIKSELENIPLKKETIDLVISNCTLNHASDKQRVWNEIYRILKNGGRFVVSDIYAIKPIEDKYKNDPQAVAECWAGAITKDEYMSVLGKAGFSNIEVIEESKPHLKGQAEVVSITIKGIKPAELYSCC